MQAGVVLLLCSTAVGSAFAQIQEGVGIPAPGGYTVAATILRPAGPGPFGDDGHYVFGDRAGIGYWLPAVESFLARHDVPFKRLDTSAALNR